jgi:hypothetical protein
MTTALIPRTFEARELPRELDWSERINLWLEIDSKRRRAKLAAKLHPLITALSVFRRTRRSSPSRSASEGA